MSSSKNETPKKSGIAWSPIDFPQDKSASAGATVAGIFLGCIPLSAGLCRTSFVQSFLTSTFRFGLNCFGTLAGSPQAVVQGGAKDAMHLLLFAGAFNALMTYTLTPGLSIWGQSICGGYQNKEPRSGRGRLTGVGMRMVATHHNMIETFPVFALTVAAIAACAPPTSTNDVLLTYTLFHVFLKTLVYIPAYVYDIDVLRSTSHGLAVGSSVCAIWNVMTRV